MKSVRIFLIGFVLTAASAVAQNLLINGSFELSAPTRSGLLLSPGATNLPGWAIGASGSLYVVRGPTIRSFAAAEGVQYVDLNGYGVTLSQSFPTTVGEIYETRFSVGRYQSVVPFRLEVAVLTESSEVLTNVVAVVPLAVGGASQRRSVSPQPRLQLPFDSPTPQGPATMIWLWMMFRWNELHRVYPLPVHRFVFAGSRRPFGCTSYSFGRSLPQTSGRT